MRAKAKTPIAKVFDCPSFLLILLGLDLGEADDEGCVLEEREGIGGRPEVVGVVPFALGRAPPAGPASRPIRGRS